MQEEEAEAGVVIPEILPPTDDWIFKLLFGSERGRRILEAFLKSLIGLPDEECELVLLDTHLKPEFADDKLGVVDVKVKTKSGRIIDIEIQMSDQKAVIGRRLSFYKSKLITGQIAKGDSYEVIEEVVCVLIMNWTLFEGVADWLNDFRFYNKKNDFYFEQMPEKIYTLELPKVPEEGSGAAWEWMRFLKAREKEEFDMLASKNKAIGEAVEELYEISADKEARAQYEYRLKAQRDRLSAINSAYKDGQSNGKKEGLIEGQRQGKLETARMLKEMGIPLTQIARATGLSLEEIRQL
jgi:predicted transposase/invertase (TIGR01784 family)